MRRAVLIAAVLLLVVPAGISTQSPTASPPTKLPGLKAAVDVARDVYGLAHIRAGNEHDLFFMQGYVHAQDRLFQMDVSRRRASGTLAELLGPGALPSDVQTRTLGIRRAAQRSLPLASARGRAALEAYAAGVNAYVAGRPLPPEYQALEVSRFEPWTALDAMTVAKSIAFSLSFDLADIDNTQALLAYQQAYGAQQGFVLFSQDLWRSQPFDPASTVPDATLASAAVATGLGRSVPLAGIADEGQPTPTIDPAVRELAAGYAAEIREVPFMRQFLDRDDRSGSNQWAVAASHTTSGRPLVANDPHLALGIPSTFYPVHLEAGQIDVMGSGFAGVPFVIVGQNRYVAWGATVNPLDVTDVFQEQLVPDPASPSGFSSVYQGRTEPVIPIPETFRYNRPGNGTADDVAVAAPGTTVGGAFIPPATLVMPRRNNGPIVQLDQATGVALSVQYTGFSGTREVDTFLIWDEARGLEDFLEGLQYFDSGAQNFAYADIHGTIAYLTSSEVPVREDLQGGTVAGAPPWFIRNGRGGNEWLPVQHHQPGQAVPFEILPFDEMPKVINPPAGWFVNANNDPAGTTLDNNPLNQLRPGGGLYYLNAAYDAGFRAGRITELVRGRLAGGGRMGFDDMQAIQADTVMLDAQVLVPTVVTALDRARAAGADPALAALATTRVVEAVGRLGRWDFTTPTGIREGYDAADDNGVRREPTAQEISSSVAATLYSVWRGQFIRNTIDVAIGSLPKPGAQLAVVALRNLLDRFPVTQGVGLSGVNFFVAPPAAAADRRDYLVLKSLSDALDRLSGAPFEAAFGRSSDQADYRWGKLHRIVFAHPLGGPFSIPPAGGAFPAPLAGLAGLPTDGGFGVPDASNHDSRAQSVNDFMYASGPVNRFVAEAGVPGVSAESVWPGGTSGVLGNPNYANLLPRYLTNDTIPLLIRQGDLQGNLASVASFVPTK